MAIVRRVWTTDHASKRHHGPDSFTTDDQFQTVDEVGDHGFGRAPAIISLHPPLHNYVFRIPHFFLVAGALDILASGSACGEGYQGTKRFLRERWGREPRGVFGISTDLGYALF